MSTQRKAHFSLIIGRDPIVPLNLFLMPTVRYLGTNENIFSLEALKNMYQLIASNLEQLKRKGIPQLLHLIENLEIVIQFYLKITH